MQGDSVDETPPGTVSRGTATVALSDESQTLNLRAAPTTNAAVIAHLRHGQTLTVLERYDSWTYVQYGTLTRYVSNDYIIYDAAGGQEETPEPEAPEGDVLTATVHLQSASSMLNVRESRSLSARVLTRLPMGEVVTVTQWGAEWCAVEARGVSGYCATAYLRFNEQTTPPQDGDSGNQEGTATEMMAIVLPSDGLNLRAAASRTSSVIMTLPQGTMLSVAGEEQNGMLPVMLGSVKGYVASEYVYGDRRGALNPGADGYARADPVPASRADGNGHGV